MDLNKIANNLIKKDGIYFSRNDSLISYPEDGNVNCFQIEENSFWFKHRNNCIVSLVEKILPKGDLFFDIGGGNGYVAKELERNNVNTVLVEPGTLGALNASKRGLKNIVCASLEDAGFSPNSIPAVGLFDVVEHIENDFAFVNMIHNYLVPGGKVFITVPAHQFLWSEDDVVAQHYRRYNLDNMKTLLEKNNFNILYSTYMFSILPLPIYLFRCIPSKLGRATNAADVEKHQKEHSPKKGIINNVLNGVWNWELNRIKRLQRISFGGSCLVVAEKI